MGIRQRPVVHPFDGGREIGGSSSPVSRKLIDFDEIVEAQAFAGQEDEGRLRWLASQIIGIDAEMVSPFGSRRITYCDHTASGRFLRFIEEFLTARVLPYYGLLLFLLSSSSSSSSSFSFYSSSSSSREYPHAG